MMQRIARSQRGFALVAAILACMILMAIGILVITISTQDLRTSARTVGDKKALSATETGMHSIMGTFDPQNLGASVQNNIQVDVNDLSFYSIGLPRLPSVGPSIVPLAGYAIGGGQQWGLKVYIVTINGRNSAYNSQAAVDVGIGYGPVEATTMAR